METNSFFSLIWVCDKKIHENSQHSSVLLSNLERRESDKMSDTLPDWQTERLSELPNLLLIVSDVQEGVSHYQKLVMVMKMVCGNHFVRKVCLSLFWDEAFMQMSHPVQVFPFSENGVWIETSSLEHH